MIIGGRDCLKNASAATLTGYACLVPSLGECLGMKCSPETVLSLKRMQKEKEGGEEVGEEEGL